MGCALAKDKTVVLREAKHQLRGFVTEAKA
jgi:hypothetical protein